MNWERPLYQSGSKPFFFFAVFGARFEQMRISEEHHRVNEIPAGLQFMQYHAAEHGEYLSAFYSNQIGELLREKGDDVFRGVIRAPSCLVAVGTVEHDRSLDYLRNTVGIVQCMLEQNAAAVFDGNALRWHTPQEWTDTFFFAERLEPLDHVSFLVTQQAPGTSWLHTRGMRKFGRPDIGIRSVPEASVANVTSLVGRLIELQAAGVVLGEETSVAWRGAEWTLRGVPDRNFDNPDFNNESIAYEYDPSWDKA
ncbi:hypothetical protein [Gordoniibacillus kamchatkensis]|uniref:hypothetical protein n=1 Tax=Gordoniibacillus kamchatkensis TaxID=1590651 RepID=UPI000696240A|nr:hypothetical protein [Paenibacillus sp. VKM B-2647]